MKIDQTLGVVQYFSIELTFYSRVNGDIPIYSNQFHFRVSTYIFSLLIRDAEFHGFVGFQFHINVFCRGSKFVDEAMHKYY